MVDKYASQIGISQRQIPNIVFTTAEVKPIEYTFGRRTSAYKFFVCYNDARTIFVNATVKQDLRNTVIHELVHYRFSYMNHGMIMNIA